MAELIATQLINVIFQKLADEALTKFVRSTGIHSELQNLKNTLYDIQNLLNDASDKEHSDKGVKRWLNSLQHLAYDIDDILDGLATDAMHRELNTSMVRKFVPTCCTNVSLSYRLSDKLDSIATKLQALEKKKEMLGLTVKDEKPKNTSRRYETSVLDESRIVGRDSDKNKLLHKLLGDEPSDKKFGVVPIVGMGGVGKTTLARVLYNETQVNDHFELKAWVCVSDEFDVFKISKNIFEEMTGENKEFGNLNTLQTALIEKLTEKRFLLVLDDVWSEKYDDWENLVRPFHSGAQGSKIIVTTRKEGLLQKLGYDYLNRLNSLSHDDALTLFVYHALGVDNFDSHSTLKQQGEGIVNKCGGLPLALKALGRMLRTKTNIEDWDDVLNSEIWGLEKVDEIVPALRLSYHDLPGCLKQLFAYCSLFPKDFLFEKDDLVLLWMAEGFLSQSIGNKPVERLGHEYFEMLLSRSFFQLAPNEESLYVMHDLMHDLAVFVFRDCFSGFDDPMGTEENYRHISFIRENYITYQSFETVKKAKRLRTLLAVSVGLKHNISYLSNKILGDLIPELPLLRVLSLSYFQMTEVPEIIGSLKHLRYLNLSYTPIRELPENVSNLYNLQTLIVFGCRQLNKLPTSFLKLKKLRHFDNGNTPLLKKMPLGIGELKNLQTLTKILVGENDGFAITELQKLKNLHGKTSIQGLEKVKNAANARDTNLSLNRLTELELVWGEVFDGSRNEEVEKEVLGELKPNSGKLKKLEIKLYGGAKFPNWVGDPSFLQLVYVSIVGCRKCTSLPLLAQLPSLKMLYIYDMVEVKVVGSELPGPSLEILWFDKMDGWELWSSNSGVMFPRLRELRIRHCPNLVEVSFESLPSLRVLEIDGCGDGVLRSIVRAASSVSELEIRKISGLTDEAWKGVMMNLGAVEELEVRNCNEMMYLWESEAEASKVLGNLKKLEVRNCSKLVSLGEKEEEEEEEEGICGSNLPLLTSLTVWNCESMKHCICGNSIEHLSISDCSSLTSVSFPTTSTGGEQQQNLKSLKIWKCEKLWIKELGGNNNNRMKMAMLESIELENWPNLKSMNELITYSTHLTRLTISDCNSLESLPDREFLNLNSLKHLTIENCPSMDASFPSGNWPPKLSTLLIGGLKKPISEWGNQNFPTSLVKLGLDGTGDDCNNSQLSDLLPRSLTSLYLINFEKLDSVSTGLQHLTSLQHLFIYSCPEIDDLPENLASLQHLRIKNCSKIKDLPENLTSLRHLSIHFCPEIKDLPETLLPSLLSLEIWGCPKLQERSKGRGSHYWPLISHIPKIQIHGF